MPDPNSGRIEHMALSLSLRAPRVAIVVPTTDNWHFVASTAIHRATRVWGGAGFILIPHNKGKVDDIMARIAAAYDPDHVVSIHDVSFADLVEAGACEWPFEGGDPEPSSLREKGDPTGALSPFDQEAREQVSAACTPYRFGILGERDAHDCLFYLEAGSTPGAALVEVKPDRADEEPRPSLRDPLTRDCALFLASLYGLASPPRPDALVGDAREEARATSDPRVDSDGVSSFARWSSPRSAWRAGLLGLTSVGSATVEPNDWLVVGGEFSDYALSYALARLDGNSVWIPQDWLETDSPMRSYAHRLFSSLYWRSRKGAKISVVSTSLSFDELNLVVPGLGSLAQLDRGSRGGELRVVDQSEVRSSDGNHRLALERDFDHEVLLPTRLDAGDNETVVLANPFPAVMPETVLDGLDTPTWHIDVDLSSSSMPGGRGLEWHVLQENDSGRWPERTRSGRDGVSMSSASFGLVLAGASPRQRLARPLLRFPSALSWVRAMATPHGYSVSISAAGHKTKISADIWGGRDMMSASMAESMPIFNEFICSSAGQKTKDRYPDDDGCAIRGEGFLTFEAIRRVGGKPDDDPAPLRSMVDHLGLLGVLRRGLILACGACTRVQWIPAAEITKAICARCQAHIPLAHESWGRPVEEPRWFYDLHPVVRDVIEECGHVAVLAGRHLQPKWRARSTVLPDIEFKSAKDHFEIDLVLTSRNRVYVGECKHRPAIPTNEVSKKLHALVRSAALLRADEIVRASGQPGAWDHEFVQKLADRVASTRWVSGKQPRIRLLTDVFGEITDRYHEREPDDTRSPTSDDGEFTSEI